MPSLLRHNRRVESRAKPLAKAVERWARKYALQVVNEEISKRRLGRRAKAKPPLGDLDRVLSFYGLRQARETATKTANGTKLEYSATVLDNWVQRDYFRGKSVRVKGIARQTKRMVQLAIRNIIQDSVRETPRPSTAEIARRIRVAYREGKLPGMKAAISPARALLIARTEMVQAENGGISAGYKASGLEPVGPFVNGTTGKELDYPGDPTAPISETANCRCTMGVVRTGGETFFVWMAYNDGRSGDRRHDLMDGQRVRAEGRAA